MKPVAAGSGLREALEAQILEHSSQQTSSGVFDSLFGTQAEEIESVQGEPQRFAHSQQFSDVPEVLGEEEEDPIPEPQTQERVVIDVDDDEQTTAAAISEIWSAVRNAQAQLAKLEDRRQHSRKTFNGNVRAINVKFGKIEDKMGKIEQNAGQEDERLEGEISELKDRTDELEAKIKELTDAKEAAQSSAINLLPETQNPIPDLSTAGDAAREQMDVELAKFKNDAAAEIEAYKAQLQDLKHTAEEEVTSLKRKRSDYEEVVQAPHVRPMKKLRVVRTLAQSAAVLGVGAAACWSALAYT
jgi:predicted  nucleic acid-binding Zn-ribbon protein